MVGQAKHFVLYALLAILLFCVAANVLAQKQPAGKVVVIAHQQVAADELTLQELRDYYLRERLIWPDEQIIVLFDLKPRSLIKDTFYEYLGKSSSRIKSVWLKKMLAGEGQPPEAVESEEEMVKKVAETPGAIGFVSQGFADASVKIVMTIEPDKR